METSDDETPATPPPEPGPHLRQLYAFGFEGIPGKNKQFACIDVHTLAYPLGCNVVIHSLNHKTMHLVAMHTTVECILAISSAPSGKLLAVCLRMKSGPAQVSIIDTKKPKIAMTLTAPSSVTELEACAISKDEQRAVAFTKRSIVCWELVHGKVSTNVAIFVDITALSLNPRDVDEFSVSGPSNFRVWNLKLGQTTSHAIKGLDPGEQLTLTDHDWLEDGGIVVATAESGILIVRGDELQNTLEDSENTLCVVATPTGFLAGGADGSIVEYKASGRPPVYSKIQLTKSGVHGPVASIALPPNVENIAYVQQEGKLLKLDYTNAESEGPKDLIDLHVSDFKAMTAMDICPHRKLLVTCGIDKMIRVWNYSRLECELIYNCEEQLTGIIINPWGYELLVEMSCTSIIVFGILANRLERRRELTLAGCGQMKYSPSGNIVAVCCGREIMIYSAFNWHLLAVLKAHIAKVTAIAWSRCSHYLVSAGVDGAIYGWTMDDYKRHEEVVTKGSQYSCVLYDAERTFLYCSGPQLSLRIVSTSNKPPPELLQAFPSNVTIGVYDNISMDEVYRSSVLWELHEQPHFCHLVGFFEKRLVFAVTESQALHGYAYPFTSSTTRSVLKLPSQAGRVAGLCVDEKHGVIFVRNTVGTIYACKLEDHRPSITGEPPQCLIDVFPVEDDDTTNWLLVRRVELEQLHQQIQDLKTSLQAEHDDSRYRQHRIQQDWAEKLKNKEEEVEFREFQHVQEMQELKEKLDSAEKNLEIVTENLLQAQSRETASLYELFESKFTGETAKTDHWRTEAEKAKEESQKRLKSQEKVHTAEIQSLQESLKAKEIEAAEKLAKLQMDCDRDIREYKTYMEEDLLINEEETIAALSQMKNALERQERNLDETRAQLLLEKRVATGYQMRIAELSDVCSGQVSNIAKQELEIAKLENFATEFDYKRRILDKLVEEADDHRKRLMLATKERETLTVLQHSKIQQLLENEKPLVEEISRLKQKISDMQVREMLDAKYKVAKEEMTRRMKERISELESRGFRLLNQLRQKDEFLNAFKEVLCFIVQDHDPVEWAPLTRGLFLAYVKESERAAVAEGLESRAQIMKQRQILEDFVVLLKSTMERTKRRTKEEIQHFIKENLSMMRDISETNRNVRRMALMIQRLQQQVAYFKGIVSMQKRKLIQAGSVSPPPRRSVTELPPRRTTAQAATSQEARRKTREAQDEEMYKFVSVGAPTPVADIVKPYSRFSIVHGERKDSTRRMTSSELDRRMSSPWQLGTSRSGRRPSSGAAVRMEELTRQLAEAKAECSSKHEEIVALKEALKYKAGSKRVLTPTPVRMHSPTPGRMHSPTPRMH